MIDSQDTLIKFYISLKISRFNIEFKMCNLLHSESPDKTSTTIMCIILAFT
jgi:hypothetical protein